jgi:hypothetical protein
MYASYMCYKNKESVQGLSAKLLLVLASTGIHNSESHGTREHILLGARTCTDLDYITLETEFIVGY